MQMSHGARVTMLMVLVLALTILCGSGALLTALEMERLMGVMVSRSAPGVVAASELQKALLQQRGIVSAYFLEGHPGWLNDLDRAKPAVPRWMAAARAGANTAEEQQVLESLAGVYRTYDAERERAIALYEAGHRVEARNVLLRDVSLLATQAQDLCDQLVQAKQRHMASALADGHRRVERLQVLLAVGMAISVALGLTVLVLLFRDVLRPVRRLAQDAKAVADAAPADAPTRFPDELHELEFYSRAVMSDMSRTRASLEESQQKLLGAEKLAAVGQFAARVAHEIRSPLTSMKMWLFQIRQMAASHPEIEHSCRVLEIEMNRLDEMATSFVLLSRPSQPKAAPSDLTTIVNDTLELADQRLRDKGLRAERMNGKSLPPVNVDSNQLRQVFLNLITNAADATPRGGVIRIHGAVETGEGGGPEVVVRVEDGGSGIPEAVRERIFDPFVTTKPHGTGLGLPIAASIVAQHKGRLVLESSCEHGSVFAVRIPAHEEAA